MSNLIYEFSRLANEFSSWSALSAHLQSDAGGLLKISHKEDDQYAIIKYVKGISNFNLSHTSFFRSVLWDTHANAPVGMGPTKAATVPTLQDLIGPLSVEEFMEGVMINVFTTDGTTLQFATRSSLGAKGGFYSKKSFADMIADVKTMNTAKILALLPKPTTDFPSSFASFVLQHPEHRIVAEVRDPSLTCVLLGTVSKDKTVTLLDVPSEVGPLVYADLEDGQFALSRVEKLAISKQTGWQGLVFRDRNDKTKRWRIRSMSYKILRTLRGQEATVEERFARLRSQGNLRVYLLTWPEEKQTFFDLEMKLRRQTSQVYAEYCEVHKERKKVLADVPLYCRSIVWALHGLYLTTLKAQGQTVKMPTVIQMVNTLPLDKLVWLLKASSS